MHGIWASFLALALLACNGDAPGFEGPPPAARFPLLADADAGSAVKIASVERLCEKVAHGRAIAVTAIAFRGQRLRWKGIVQGHRGSRLLVGVHRMLIVLTEDPRSEESFEPDEQVEIAGVISNLDPKNRRITLGPEAEVSAPGW